jgi:hypothetical protein
MRRLRIYLDTSVIGGAHDKEFAAFTRQFLDQVKANRHILLLSSTTYLELERAPILVRQVLVDIPPGRTEVIPDSEDVTNLSLAYIEAGAIGAKHRADADHVAAATVAGADLIVSWNFKHIVNLDHIRKYNAVNLLKGYGAVEIRSPREIAYGDETEDLRLRGDEESDPEGSHG